LKAIAVTPTNRELKLIDMPMPAITSLTQVRLRILDVGVCGTDREICSFQYGTPPEGLDYLVIGHESVGEVVETGSKVKSLKPGDLVVTTVRRPCAHAECLACTTDRADFCYTGDFSERGIKQKHGFMTEFVVDDEHYMNVVPQSLRDTAVLVEPLTIAEKALEQIWSVQERAPWACPHIKQEGVGHCHRALVLGAGPVGLLGAMALSNEGFETYVYSRELAPNPKSSIVQAIGATYLSAQEVSLDDVVKTIGNIDLVYEASGASQLSFEVIERLGPNGIFVFTGVPGRKAPVAVDTDRIMRNLVLNNQVVFGSVNASRPAFQNAISDLATFNENWPDAVKTLITGRHPVSAFRDLLLGPAQGIKNVLAFG
jgi:threonine dehydrogenase-like Zn-dependent dehydrogenase